MSNNYFGFTYGGTQYTGTAGASYQPTSYATTGQPTYQFQYATAPVQSYTAFQKSMTNPKAVSPVVNVAKPFTVQYTPGIVATPKAVPPTPSVSSFKSNSTSYNYTGGGGNTYESAIFKVASSYYNNKGNGGNRGGGSGRGSSSAMHRGRGRSRGGSSYIQHTQVHYCDVCKISCASAQTYKDHLDGQKHKKKAASDTNQPLIPGQKTLKCPLCDIICTSVDTYDSHIRGAKHQKVEKLYQKLGKAVPKIDPVIMEVQKGNGVPGGVTDNSAFEVSSTNVTTTKVSVPKIQFVGGAELNTTKEKTTSIVSGKTVIEATVAPGTDVRALTINELGQKINILGEREPEPIGQDYIEELRNDGGKVVNFECKLCDCKFNDPNAKDMHLKGKRHRMMYKKKVNPDLVVEVKMSSKHKRLQEERFKKVQVDNYFKQQKQESALRYHQMRKFEEDMIVASTDVDYQRQLAKYNEEMVYYDYIRRNADPRRPLPPPPRPPPPPNSRLGNMETLDDRHVMAKHQMVYPSEEELSAVQVAVSNTEKALKLVSDVLSEQTKSEGGEEANTGATIPPKEQDRQLMGVMRVGTLAKGLILKNNLDVELIILTSSKPTRGVLLKVAEQLPKQMPKATEDKYDFKIQMDEGAIVLRTQKEPKITVKIQITSPTLREKTAEVDPPDMLNRNKCLEALAQLRHAKWFQAKAASLQSCVIVIRILRDLCMRIPSWNPFDPWAMELLVEKVVSSACGPMGPGEALRRIFEAVAGGILLPGTPGLIDPCEKDPVDVISSLKKQEKEDITASAQHALRMMAFRQVHKVLGMEALPAPGKESRKRPRENKDDDCTADKKEKVEVPVVGK